MALETQYSMDLNVSSVYMLFSWISQEKKMCIWSEQRIIGSDDHTWNQNGWIARIGRCDGRIFGVIGWWHMPYRLLVLAGDWIVEHVTGNMQHSMDLNVSSVAVHIFCVQLKLSLSTDWVDYQKHCLKKITQSLLWIRQQWDTETWTKWNVFNINLCRKRLLRLILDWFERPSERKREIYLWGQAWPERPNQALRASTFWMFLLFMFYVEWNAKESSH